MSFKKLITKVEQAENALETRERHVVAHWSQLKGSWRDAWTPGRIVIAGLIGGFLLGRAEPMRRLARSGGLVQLLAQVPGLFAKSAQAATEAAAMAEAFNDLRAPAAEAGPESQTPEEELQTARAAAEAVEPVEP